MYNVIYIYLLILRLGRHIHFYLLHKIPNILLVQYYRTRSLDSYALTYHNENLLIKICIY